MSRLLLTLVFALVTLGIASTPVFANGDAGAADDPSWWGSDIGRNPQRWGPDYGPSAVQSPAPRAGRFADTEPPQRVVQPEPRSAVSAPRSRTDIRTDVGIVEGRPESLIREEGNSE